MKNEPDLKGHGKKSDKELVAPAIRGDKHALEILIENHQQWIYNIVLRMIGNPDDAKDITQEILIKIITKLTTFKQQSNFRTWAYRIAANHVLNMRKQLWERLFYSFEEHGDLIDRLALTNIDNSKSSQSDQKILEEETKIGCMTGMLLCLDRVQRLALILGSIFGVDSKTAAAILEIKPAHFRQILCRARKQLSNFMNDKCGLANENNPCRCAFKTEAAIKAGLVNPGKMRFTSNYYKRVEDFVLANNELIDKSLEFRTENLLRAQPMYESPDYVKIINRILERDEIRKIVNF